MTNENFAAGDAALPDDAEMRLYARAFADMTTGDDLFLRWEGYLAHSMLFEQAPDRTYPDYGLTGRQLAAGARIAARRMALLLAERPTDLRAVLALKLQTFEAMAPLGAEGTASNAIFMVEAAMKADAARCVIVLPPLSQPPGRAQ